MNNKRAKVDVIIRADGSKQIGMGHIIPMITLALELARNGLRISFVSFDDERTINALSVNRLPVNKIPDTKAFNEVRKHVYNLSPRLVIQNTWQNENEEHFKALKIAGGKLIGFHQLKLGLQQCNAVINPLPSSFARDKTNITADYFEGPEFMILSSDAQEIGKKDRKINDQIEKVVVSVGGTDSYNLSPGIEKLLKQILPRAEITAVTGGVPQTELFQLVHESDLAITAGGNSIFEFAHLGTPTVALAQETWEEKTIEFVEKHGAAVYAGFRDETLDNLAGIIRKLGAKRRQDMSTAGRKLVDGKGLQRVMAIIKNLL